MVALPNEQVLGCVLGVCSNKNITFTFARNRAQACGMTTMQRDDDEGLVEDTMRLLRIMKGSPAGGCGVCVCVCNARSICAHSI